MRKQTRKTVFLLLAVILAMGTVISGCGKDDADESKPVKTAESEALVEAAFKNGKYDPPVTLTTWGTYNKTTKFKDGETFENNSARTWMKDNLGVDIQYPWTSQWENNAYVTKLRLSLSANEPLPDVIAVSTDDQGKQLIKDLIETGSFMDVTELFNKYASPTYKDILDKHPEIWNVVTQDGKRYGIPLTSDPYINTPVLYYREDWLNKFGLQQPKTVDELEKVLDVFTNQDPDGNGKNDTIGMVISGKEGVYGGGMANVSWLYGAYGAMPTSWTKSEDGTLEYGSIQPEAREALLKLSEWYSKGYIDPEYGIKDGGKATELVSSGKAGLVAGPYWLAMSLMPNLEQSVPGGKIVPAPLPAGPNGKIGRPTGEMVSGVFLVNKNAANPEAIMMILNKMLQFSVKEKGSDVEYGFIEGFDYTMENGVPVYSTENRIDKLILNGSAMPMVPEYNLESLAYLADGGKPRNGFDLTNAAYKPAHFPGKVVMSQVEEASIINEFTGAPTETMSSKWEALKKMEDEVYAKVIYGKEPIEAFDTFVEKWNKMGGEQITKEVNEWYTSVQNK